MEFKTWTVQDPRHGLEHGEEAPALRFAMLLHYSSEDGHVMVALCFCQGYIHRMYLRTRLSSINYQRIHTYKHTCIYAMQCFV